MPLVRTRFSPSPTGSLHLGGAHTALFNWLYARHHLGVFILRIEDTDKERSQDRYVQEILDALIWLGLSWDEGPYYQSQRLNLYQEYIHKLLDAGAAYYCDCPPADFEARRQAALARGEKPRYDGRCRERRLKKSPHTAVRFLTHQTGTTIWRDLIKGPIAFENRELDDLVLARADGLPTYNFAVVVDDITMEVTQVIRGDDHIPNTPRQLLIYEALKAAPPQFAHMPLMLGEDRAKLSKRHGALSIMAYLEMGFLPQALVNYLARLGWSHGDQEIFSRGELIQYFAVEQVTKAAGVFDQDKLLWLNSHYIKETPPAELAPLLKYHLTPLGITAPEPRYLTRVAATLQARGKTLEDMAQQARFYFQDPRPYDPAAALKFLTPAGAPLLEEIARRLEALPEVSEEALNLLFNELVAQTGLKMVNLAQPVRVALTGKTASPGLYEIINILGKPETLKRLNNALSFIQDNSKLRQDVAEK